MLIASASDIDLHCCLFPTNAIALANQIDPALILVDLIMPDLDGMSLLRLLRANPQTAATPVIVLSGNDDAATRARAVAEGANGFLVKLPPKAELIACIRNHALRGAGEAKTLDPVAIDRFHEADAPDFTRRLIDQFIREASECVQTLKDAAGRGDTGVLNATAHRLKGVSLIMGAASLAGLCTRVENEAAAPGSGAMSALMIEADDELARVRLALAARREEIDRG
jgi:CheY-like chemotaxis protein